MKTKIIKIWFLIFSLYSVFFAQERKMNQTKGLFQENKNKQIDFYNIERFQLNPKEASLREITKVIIHKSNVFILDSKLSRIFVFDLSANYLYAIGRPGQGPGDLEYPSDFTISHDQIIYVVNSMAKRIEEFSLDGKFRRRIDLSIPKNIFYSAPARILVDFNNNFLISYSLSKDLIDIYDSKGNYIKNLLERNDPTFIPGLNIGNNSQVLFFHDLNKILHFDYFSGVFTLLSDTGIIDKTFSVYQKEHFKDFSRIRKSIKEKRKIKRPGIRVNEYHIWSDCCIDNKNNIYTFLLISNKNTPQKLFTFSPEGDFLYRISIPYLENIKIDKAFYYEDYFIFLSRDQEIFLAKGRYSNEE